jgi:hypothetical protein
VSGHNRQKKDGHRKEKRTQARRPDLDQPIVAAEAKQQARDTSNFTDGDVAGPDWKSKVRKYQQP